MEIVIENDPYRRPSSTSPAPTYLRSPVSGQPHISTNSAFYYATLPRGGGSLAGSSPGAAPPRPAVIDVPDGAPTTGAVRRVDKSGLLEIAELEVPVSARPGPGGRLHAGPEGHGTLSRRLERSGLLEAVPEVPDQCHRSGLVSDELLAAAATTRSMVERQQHLLGAETDLLDAALLRRRAFAASESAQLGSSASLQTEGEPSGSTARSSGPRVKFASDEPKQMASLEEIKERLRDRQASLSARIPDVVEAHGSLPAPATTASSAAPSSGSTTATATTTATSAGGTETPRGERAEAEGCEHTIVEGLEEARLPAHKSASATTGSSAKIGHNDNIQALHVIILSEQL